MSPARAGLSLEIPILKMGPRPEFLGVIGFVVTCPSCGNPITSRDNSTDLANEDTGDRFIFHRACLYGKGA